MTYALLAAAITCSAFTIVVSFTSLIAGAAAPRLARRLTRHSPASRAAALFSLRILPAGAGIVCAFGVALPIFLWFEPRDTNEPITLTLAVTSALGLAAIVRGAARAIAAWGATRSVIRAWLKRGRAIALDASIPVVAIDEAFPIVAVVGVARPMLFISERVLNECSDDEVRAMVAHECSHVTARDNLKRFLIRACPDLLQPPDLIERAWSNAAEEAADAAAARNTPNTQQRALDLAQALIHVARLAPQPHAPALSSAFYLGGSIESRIRRLLEPGHLADPARPLGWVLFTTVVCVFAISVVAAAPAVHQLMEAVVHVLP